MDENMMRELMNNPQLMAAIQEEVMRNPGLINKLQNIQSNPQEAMNDPELMSLFQRIGGMGGLPGMGGMGGGSSSSAPAEPPNNVINITSPSQYRYKMQQAQKDGVPVIIDFTMNGCRPCKMLKPEFARLSNTYKDKLLFFCVDMAQNREVVNELGITGFPTVVGYTAEGKKEDTITGFNLSGVESLCNNLVRSLQTKVVQALFKQFQHFPIKEAEVVTYKQIAWDKVQQKINAVLTAADVPVGLYAPFPADSEHVALNYADAAALKQELIKITEFLNNFQTTSMQDIPNTFMRCLSVITEGWLVTEHYTVPLHVLRLGALHNDFAKNMATSKYNFFQKLCTFGQETSDTISSILTARTLCNFFIKKSFVRLVLTNVENLKAVIAYQVITYNEDNNTMASVLSLLVNLTYTIFAYTPTQADALKTPTIDNIMVKLIFDLFEVIIDTLPMFITDNKAQIYPCVVATGTLLFPFYLMKAKVNQKQEAEQFAKIMVHVNFVKNHFQTNTNLKEQLTTWKEAVAGDAKITQAIDDVTKLFESL